MLPVCKPDQTNLECCTVPPHFDIDSMMSKRSKHSISNRISAKQPSLASKTEEITVFSIFFKCHSLLIGLEQLQQINDKYMSISVMHARYCHQHYNSNMQFFTNNVTDVAVANYYHPYAGIGLMFFN